MNFKMVTIQHKTNFNWVASSRVRSHVTEDILERDWHYWVKVLGVDGVE